MMTAKIKGYAGGERERKSLVETLASFNMQLIPVKNSLLFF